MYPSSGDEGRMTFKAGYNWCGDKIEYRYSDAKLTKAEACALDKENHRALKRALSVANLGEGKYTTRYYDSNADGNVDYVWILPYTWGKIVNKTGDSNLTTTKHTGNSAYRAYYNSSKKIPEIYVGGRDFITRLAYASEVEVGTQAPQDLNGMVTVSTHDATMYLPLAELVDIEKELERIGTEITKARENLERIEKKLQNESFVSKAPEAVVNAEREKADKARALIVKLEESAQAMRG